MEQKIINIVIFRVLSFSLFIFLAESSFSQDVINENIDTMSIQEDNSRKIEKLHIMNNKDTFNILKNDKITIQEASKTNFPLIDNSYIYKSRFNPSFTDKNILQDARLSEISIPSFKYAPYATWRGGYIGTSGNIQSMRGMMDMASGSVLFNQNIGILNISAYGIANKYALPFYKYNTNQFGYGGLVSLKLWENASLNAFGTYYATMPVMPATAAPYAASTNFGGFMDLGFSKSAGIDLGARHYFNTFTGHWITDPIVSPYIKLNGKDKLGIDFGGLLKSFIFGKDHYEGEGPMPMKARPMRIMKPRR